MDEDIRTFRVVFDISVSQRNLDWHHNLTPKWIEHMIAPQGSVFSVSHTQVLDITEAHGSR
jgi:hypothetical protein